MVTVNVPLETVNLAIQGLATLRENTTQHINLLQQRAQEAINAFEEAQRRMQEANPEQS